jgi:hypothetical protein
MNIKFILVMFSLSFIPFDQSIDIEQINKVQDLNI